MRTLIAYATSHGSTEKAALALQQILGGPVLVVLKRDQLPNMEGFDAVIVGGSIDAGRIQRQVKAFCRANLDTLRKKRLGLYICCMEEGEKAEKQFEQAYPQVLRSHATAKGFFGGEFTFSRMNFVERAIIRRISGSSQDVCRLNEQAIADFAKAFE